MSPPTVRSCTLSIAFKNAQFNGIYIFRITERETAETSVVSHYDKAGSRKTSWVSDHRWRWNQILCSQRHPATCRAASALRKNNNPTPPSFCIKIFRRSPGDWNYDFPTNVYATWPFMRFVCRLYEIYLYSVLILFSFEIRWNVWNKSMRFKWGSR